MAVGGAQEVRDRDTEDLGGVLHREEESGASAGVDRHGEDVFAVEGDQPRVTTYLG